MYHVDPAKKEHTRDVNLAAAKDTVVVRPPGKRILYLYYSSTTDWLGAKVKAPWMCHFGGHTANPLEIIDFAKNFKW